MFPIITLLENVKVRPFWLAILSDLVGTALLVFIGCGSIVLTSAAEPTETHTTDIVRVALTFGFAVTVIITALGPVIDCHINPAVSIGLVFAGRCTVLKASLHVLVQLLGSVIGSGMLYLVTPRDQRGNMGMTNFTHDISALQAVIAEIVMTFILLIVVSACLDEERPDYESAKVNNALLIGLTVVALNMKGIPYTGASTNPARSFGPAVIKMNFENQWVFWVGPIIGGFLGALAYRFLLKEHYATSNQVTVVQKNGIEVSLANITMGGRAISHISRVSQRSDATTSSRVSSSSAASYASGFSGTSNASAIRKGTKKVPNATKATTLSATPFDTMF